MKSIRDLQQVESDPNEFNKKTGATGNLQRIASDKGFGICDNPGSGNCMFYALSEQLQSVKGMQISETELRKKLVECLRTSPQLVSLWSTDRCVLMRMKVCFECWENRALKSLRLTDDKI